VKVDKYRCSLLLHSKVVLTFVPFASAFERSGVVLIRTWSFRKSFVVRSEDAKCFVSWLGCFRPVTLCDVSHTTQALLGPLRPCERSELVTVTTKQLINLSFVSRIFTLNLAAECLKFSVVHVRISCTVLINLIIALACFC